MLIGAHYDAVEVSPGADDNGSGTVAVLEIARVLAGSRPDKTILFALWDAEEVGLVGSTRYAQEAYARGDRIEAVINLDMIGWNRSDPVLLVTSYDPYSGTWLEDRLLGLASGLNLPLDARSHSMGRSDHVPFATLGFESVMLIEDYGNDFNPYYHSNFDTIDKLDFEYLTAATRLAAAGVVSAAFGGTYGVGTEDPALPLSAVGAPYPNPATGPVRFAAAETAQVALYDLLGRRVAIAEAGEMDVSGLPAGVYVYRASNGPRERTGTLVVHR